MTRIAGVNIPAKKTLFSSLQYIHGIGPFKAKEICKKRKQEAFTSTQQLAELITEIYKNTFKKNSRKHPATKTFQALRIEVNDEIKVLKEGLQQANEIFAADLSRLKRDYLGIVLYRRLLAQGMITSPKVAKADLGVTGDADQIRINDEVMRITAHSALQPNSNQWNPVLTK